MMTETLYACASPTGRGTLIHVTRDKVLALCGLRGVSPVDDWQDIDFYIRDQLCARCAKKMRATAVVVRTTKEN